jgi:signal transduction histidine kinase
MKRESDKPRVLVIAPFGRDGQLICDELQRTKIPCEQVRDIEHLCELFGADVSALIIAEESLSAPHLECLAELLRKQEAWSDIPVLLLTGGGKTTRGSMQIATNLSGCANITLLERPVRVLTLLSAVQAALRARRKQYEVRDLLADAQRSVRQRDEFLAMLGHELRNPVGTIRNAIEVLENVSREGDGTEAEQRAIIRRQARHMGHLIDDLLDVSRVTTGKISLTKLAVDVRELVQRCLQGVEAAVSAERHTLTSELDPDPLVAEADPVRIEQVVTNLLTNAVKYTPTGGKIHVSALREDGHAVIKVRDNGMGIASELLPHVFDLFTQGHHTLDRSHGGLGIGLTVVKSLVEMHGGTISAKSEGARKGTEFTVRLPLTTAPIKVIEPPLRSPTTRRRVLVVEDNADARKALRVLLQLCGHSVEVAEDGREGVEKAVALQPDVALVDIGLPKLDGYRVAREVRESLGKTIRLVALTGYGQPEDQQRALDAGFDLHLTKPVDPTQLFETISRE